MAAGAEAPPEAGRREWHRRAAEGLKKNGRRRQADGMRLWFLTSPAGPTTWNLFGLPIDMDDEVDAFLFTTQDRQCKWLHKACQKFKPVILLLLSAPTIVRNEIFLFNNNKQELAT